MPGNNFALNLQRILRKQNPDILNILTTWMKSHQSNMKTDTMTVSIQVQDKAILINI